MRTDRSLSQGLIEKALQHGADLAEVYQRTVKGISVDVKESALESADKISSFGFGLRVIKDNRQGFSYSNDPLDADRVVEGSLAALGHSGEDASFTLPRPSKFADMDIFDHAVADISESSAIEFARMIERAAKESDRRISKVRKSIASFRSGGVMIMNSLGLEQAYSSTTCSAQVMAVAEDKGEGQVGWGFSTGRFIDEVSFVRVGEEAAKRAAQMLGAQSPPTIKAPILLEPIVAAGFVSVAVSMLSAESVQKGRSLFKDRIGEKVFDEQVSIIDDGLSEIGAGRRPFDDEGCPVSMNEFISEGVLAGYMHNSRTASKDHAGSTGNAVRAGFSSPPGVGPINLYLKPGGNVTDSVELLSTIRSGLHVFEAMGLHTINPVSGEYSVGVSGLWIENGTHAYPVREAVISGNLLDLFGEVIGLGSDLTFFGSLGAPSVLLGPVDISG